MINESIFSHKQVCDVLAKSRLIVGHFKHLKASKLLKEYHEQNNVPRHQRVQDEPTWLDSTYLMVERLLEQQEQSHGFCQISTYKQICHRKTGICLSRCTAH
ncbi:hypothetical protein PR048_002211 [Dryococelus australis]|uniref:Uncharacterized protein n=1 Tax=Dryococelus australis TaxID=614101 RepID=A0ABQ9IJK5_9NEOP|nr:hypothetical protein PR048_002211 [Dryococelus australis]